MRVYAAKALPQKDLHRDVWVVRNALVYSGKIPMINDSRINFRRRR
jgi:hypothetical protein